MRCMHQQGWCGTGASFAAFVVLRRRRKSQGDSFGMASCLVRFKWDLCLSYCNELGSYYQPCRHGISSSNFLTSNNAQMSADPQSYPSKFNILVVECQQEHDPWRESFTHVHWPDGSPSWMKAMKRSINMPRIKCLNAAYWLRIPSANYVLFYHISLNSTFCRHSAPSLMFAKGGLKFRNR